MNVLTRMYVHTQSHLKSKMKDEEGATMVEYALMVALIAVVCLVAVSLIGTNASAMFNTIAGKIAPAA